MPHRLIRIPHHTSISFLFTVFKNGDEGHADSSAPRPAVACGGQRRGGLRFPEWGPRAPAGQCEAAGLEVFLASSRAWGVSVLTAPPVIGTTPVPPPATRHTSSRKCPSVDWKPENTILEDPNTFQLSDKKEESISGNDAGRPGGVRHLGVMCRTFCKTITFHDAVKHLSDLRKG